MWAAPIAHAAIAATTSAGPATTPAIDTTGATFIVIAASSYVSAGSTAPTDSKGNTWTLLGTSGTASQPKVSFYINTAPTVGTGHTFTNAPGGTSYPSIAVAAFAGPAGPTFGLNADAQMAYPFASRPWVAGPVSDFVDNALILSAVGDGSNVYTVAAPFTLIDSVAGIASASFGVSLAYSIQGARAPISAAWSWPSGAVDICSLIVAVNLPGTPLATLDTQLPRLVPVVADGAVRLTHAPRLAITDAAAAVRETQAVRIAPVEVGAPANVTQLPRLTVEATDHAPPRLTQLARIAVIKPKVPISILIDGIEHNIDTRYTSLKIDYQLGARGTANVEIRDFDSFETAYRPKIDQRLLIFGTDSELLFAGTIFGVKDTPLGAPGVGTVTAIDAVDDWARATTRHVNATYAAGTTLHTIVADLINSYLGIFTIKLDPLMGPGPPMPAVTFDGVTVEEAFNQLATLSGGWVYRLQPTGIIEWFDVGDKVRDFTLSAENNNILGPITWTKSRNQFANRVCVRYGAGVAGRSEAWTGNGTTTNYPLGYPPLFPMPASNGWIAWITVAGVQEGIGTDPANSFPWFYDALNQQVIRKIAPAAGAAIAFTYNVQYPLVVCADAPAPVGSAPPQWRTFPTRGGIMADGGYMNGYGNQPSTATPPTAVTAVAMAGGTLESNANNEYGFKVTSIDAAGVESDAYPFHDHVSSGGGRGHFPDTIPTIYGTQTMPKATFTPGSQKIRVTWSGATGAVKYRCYIGAWYYLGRYSNYIETTATSCDFLSLASTPPNTTTNIWYYVVMAVLPEGALSNVSTEMVAVETGPRNRVRGWFTPIAGATGYVVCRRGAGAGFASRIDVPPDQLEGGFVYFDDDQGANTVITGLPAQVVPWEGLVDRADIFDTQEALDYANSLVARANALPRTVTLKTRAAEDFMPGDAVPLDVPSRTLPDAQWLTTEVSIIADVDQQLTVTLTLLEGLLTQASWLDFWRNVVGGGASVGVTSSAPPPTGGGGGTGTSGVTNAGDLTSHALIVGQGGTILRALADLGAAGKVLHGSPTGDPTFRPIDAVDLGGPAVDGRVLTADSTSPTGIAFLAGGGGGGGTSADAIRPITFTINPGGVPSTGIKGDISVPYACRITGVRVLADQVGSAVLDILKDSYANFPPSTGDSIVGSAPPTLASAQASEDTTLAGWTTTLNAGDTLRFNLVSVSAVTRLTITLTVAIPAVTSTPAVATGALILLESRVAAASAALIFKARNAPGTSGASIQSDFDEYVLEFLNLKPTIVSPLQDLKLQVSTDGGATFDATSGRYFYAWSYVSHSGTTGQVNGGAGGTTAITIFTSIDNTPANDGVSGTIKFFNPGATAFRKSMYFSGYAVQATAAYAYQGMGIYNLATALNALQLFMTSTTVASGVARLYGIAK